MKENDDKIKIFNLENLIIIEDSLSGILNDLRYSSTQSSNIYLNFFLTFRYTKIDHSIEYFFFTDKIKSNLISLLNLQLVSMVIGYVCSSRNTNTNLENKIKSLVDKNHQNFLLLMQMIINTLQKHNLVNVFSNKIQQIILSKISTRINKNNVQNLIEKTNSEICEIIKGILHFHKNIFLSGEEKNIFLYVKRYSKSLVQDYIKLFEKIISQNNRQSFMEINDMDSSTDEINEVLCSVSVPFLPPLTRKVSMTLVLDLDETLINFKMSGSGEKGMLRMRPGLDEFLSNVKKKNCELVLFTAATQDYADPIIDAVEGEQKYFDYRLYRQHSVSKGSNYLKDLSKLGRDLSTIIIVDNFSVNFQLQKQNGILIKGFYGNDEDDNVLDELFIVLEKIINDGDDVRKGIKKYEDEIDKKISHID